jgi:hypothetical protein
MVHEEFRFQGADLAKLEKVAGKPLPRHLGIFVPQIE